MPAARESASTSSPSADSESRGSLSATPERRRPATARMSAASRVRAAFCPATAAASRIRRSSIPSPVRADVPRICRPFIAVGLGQTAEVGPDLPGGVAVESVDLVEHDHRDGVVGGQGPQVVVVEAGVGVLLGVGHPDEDVDERQDALGLLPVLDDPRVEVGQVEQDQTVQALPG